MLEIDEINRQLEELGLDNKQIAAETKLNRSWIASFRSQRQSSKVARVLFTLYIKLKKVEKIVANNNVNT